MQVDLYNKTGLKDKFHADLSLAIYKSKSRKYFELIPTLSDQGLDVLVSPLKPHLFEHHRNSGGFISKNRSLFH